MSDVNDSESVHPSEEELHQLALAAEQEMSRFHADADASEDAAQHCKRQAWQCWLEAQQKEESAKRLRVQAQNSKRLHDSLRLDALCHPLRHNNSSTTVLNCSGFPEGYAKRLGEALQDNTHVSSVHLHLEKLILPSTLDIQEILDFVAPLLHFFRTSKALRSIHVQFKHPNLNINELLTKQLFESVVANQAGILSTLRCEWGCTIPIAVLCKGMQVNSMLKALDICFDDTSSHDERNTIEEAFRSSSTSLESLRIDTMDVDVPVSILKGLKKASNSKLHELSLSCSISSSE
jgi:hypothetical protein